MLKRCVINIKRVFKYKIKPDLIHIDASTVVNCVVQFVPNPALISVKRENMP